MASERFENRLRDLRDWWSDSMCAIPIVAGLMALGLALGLLTIITEFIDDTYPRYGLVTFWGLVAAGGLSWWLL
jgi:hypothetical protein